MENVASLAVLLAFCAAIYALVASVVGRIQRKPFLIVSGERAVYSVWVLITIGSAVLVYGLVTGDFRFSYVAQHSNRSMPLLYKFAAWWGGQEGSLLFWSWLLSTYSAVVVFTNRRKHRDIMPYVVGVLMFVQTFFLLLNNFVVSPFKMLSLEGSITAVQDGNGLNPLLQYPAMAIHPPMLYLGYVGFAVPFAFAIASLITRQPGEAWIHTTRRWTLVTWLFQGTGVMLGMAWAYHVLGWGGYWGWDAVENASLLPWLSGTAFLHSVMMQEKKGMMKVWNIVLISTTFLLCILGTSLTRTGLVNSVHAFAQGPLGKYFFSFLAICIAAIVYLILDRLQYLRSEAQLESVISRESSFLFNNLILLASCFAVLWGTLFPVISEAISGEKIGLEKEWFNKLMIPLGLFLLLLTGVGPLFAWRRTSWESLRRNFLWPGIASVVLVGALLAAGVRGFYALISFGFCLFVAMTVLMEFYKGSRAISQKNNMNLLRASVELTHRNTRRYGGYLVHMGIVLMFIGFTGAAFDLKDVKEMNVGDTLTLGHYDLKVTDVKEGENENYQWHRATVLVSSGGDVLGVLEPEKRFYKASRQGTSEVGVRPRLNEDLYLNFGGMSDDGARAVIQAYVFPLVSWIWIGGLVLIGGTLVCLVPSKIKMQYARTEVVGITKKYADVSR
ncbi:MAG TPA: heme lyase CcmF/NrfE family subunit [Bryobacteraceae bacterium]|jgi:cytochrome c-type biogenesis protein CcmF|nr:heme lyase CcmF/NrfE family subunit [Bryobacteraceae bacterium]